jgi:hypothetical protein
MVEEVEGVVVAVAVAEGGVEETNHLLISSKMLNR